MIILNEIFPVEKHQIYRISYVWVAMVATQIYWSNFECINLNRFEKFTFKLGSVSKIAMGFLAIMSLFKSCVVSEFLNSR